MSVKVLASIGTEKYYTEVTAGKNKIITDETLDKGGQDKGFNPFELLAASLATCTAATLRMYIDRKGWSVPEIDVEVELENYPQTKNAIFMRKIRYGEAILESEQLARLHHIADACPVHKMLHGNMEINTVFIEK
ncbi:OsmC family protein [Kaistella carnis]|uniref:OsmC family protein n=1 Tax=Kaistella carnis TaxID=1241979 RepID=UPI0028B22DD0|nr:OsmC family protein [Kaistella carnis]